MMREPSTEQLEQDLRLLDHAHTWCNAIVELVDDESLELELSKYKNKTAINVLEDISYAMHRRVNHINEQLEERANRTMDRFVQKQRKR